MNFTNLYKHSYSSLDELSSIEEYDYYISSFINSERVIVPPTKIKTKKNIWIVTKEEENNKFLEGYCKIIIDSDENYDIMMEMVNNIDVNDKEICIDATGFLIPDLLFLIRYLNSKGVNHLDIIYTEPLKYKKAEDTQFSDNFYEVKQIYGMSGTHISKMDNDMLIIAAGYDHSRIVDVANKKKPAKKVLLYGFPSISPGMFQENVYRAFGAEPALGSECFRDMDMNIYAPAYDPFVTAQIIKEYVQNNPYTNLYLATLSSKPQALGLALFFLWEKGYQKNISIIYPMCKNYLTDNSEGIARIWKYSFILPPQS